MTVTGKLELAAFDAQDTEKLAPFYVEHNPTGLEGIDLLDTHRPGLNPSEPGCGSDRTDDLSRWRTNTRPFSEDSTTVGLVPPSLRPRYYRRRQRPRPPRRRRSQ